MVNLASQDIIGYVYCEANVDAFFLIFVISGTALFTAIAIANFEGASSTKKDTGFLKKIADLT